MPLCEKPEYRREPTPLQCGQAVLAMLGDQRVEEVIRLVGTDRETTLADMLGALTKMGISYSSARVEVTGREELPPVCLLSLETPRCWHWSLYFDGVFYDPEHGVLEDFPTCARKYYWEIYR